MFQGDKLSYSQQECDDLTNMHTQYLTVKNTTLTDKGTYTCKVADYQNHHNNASLLVKIFGKLNHFHNCCEVIYKFTNFFLSKGQHTFTTTDINDELYFNNFCGSNNCL